MIKLAINGFGRIGRPALKVALEKENIEVVAINDLTDLKTAAHLLKYDSSYGRYDKKVEIDEGNSELIVDGQKIKYLSQPDAAKLPWGELGVDVGALRQDSVPTTNQSTSPRYRGPSS